MLRPLADSAPGALGADGGRSMVALEDVALEDVALEDVALEVTGR
ncbi:MAG: hypothetical protein ABIP94_15885 [Planctomycetota bacterium]